MACKIYRCVNMSIALLTRSSENFSCTSNADNDLQISYSGIQLSFWTSLPVINCLITWKLVTIKIIYANWDILSDCFLAMGHPKHSRKICVNQKRQKINYTVQYNPRQSSKSTKQGKSLMENESKDILISVDIIKLSYCKL